MEVINICIGITVSAILLGYFAIFLGYMLDCGWIFRYVFPILLSTAVISAIVVVFIYIVQAPKSELSDCDTCYRIKTEHYE